ncbi:MAG: alpha/beta hydrolase [Rhodothermales bacterium]|nr:alpha/beta hydrolase [Rhodothermales bacterium]
MTLDDWRRAGHPFDFRGHSIFYREGGTGEALLCLHGFPTASWDWHRLWPALTARYRVIAPDFLGFGFSAKPHPHPYHFGEQTDLVESLLAHLGLRRVLVLAHDYGDTVAQELLARHATRPGYALDLRAVCLLNGGLFPEAIRPRPIQRLLEGPLGPLVAAVLTERRFRTSFSAVFGPATQPTPAELADFWRLVRHGGGVRVAPRLSRYQQERRDRRDRWTAALRDTAVPLRLVCGALDPVSGAPIAARYREVIPRPDVAMLDDVGHYPQIEAPERVLGAFLDFVDRVG